VVAHISPCQDVKSYKTISSHTKPYQTTMFHSEDGKQGLDQVGFQSVGFFANLDLSLFVFICLDLSLFVFICLDLSFICLYLF
jgi:hypothetical protein